MSLLAKSLLQASKRTDDRLDVPSSFLEFCGWLGVKLSPGQAEWCRVSYDAVQPVDRGIAARIFGEAALSVVTRKRVVVAVCGRRAGKSYVGVALRLLHGMLVRHVPPLPPGIAAVTMVFAPRDTMRMEVFRYARGAVESKPELRRRLVIDTKDVFSLRRDDGKEVEFRQGVATSGAIAARGCWFTDFALDEVAFFRDDSYKVNDDELFQAGQAALLPGGQIILASTPWAETGLLYRYWRDKPDDAIVAHCPTLVLNDTETTRTIVEAAERLDPDNAKREFGAQFMTTGTTVFFEGSSIDAALSSESFEVQPGDQLVAGADFAFLGDSSALVMVARRGNILHVFDGAEERPQEGQPLKPSATVSTFAKKIAGRCRYVMCDGHNLATILEHFEEHGLIYAKAPTTPSETHVRARMLLRERRVVIHPMSFRDRMVQQMREVHGKPTSGGAMSIQYPRWAKGGHGDLCAAFVLALWQVSGDEVSAPEPVKGTKDWEAAEREKRQRRMAEAMNSPADRGRGSWWRRTA
jgi:hypothetical protein